MVRFAADEIENSQRRAARTNVAIEWYLNMISNFQIILHVSPLPVGYSLGYLLVVFSHIRRSSLPLRIFSLVFSFIFSVFIRLFILASMFSKTLKFRKNELHLGPYTPAKRIFTGHAGWCHDSRPQQRKTTCGRSCRYSCLLEGIGSKG